MGFFSDITGAVNSAANAAAAQLSALTRANSRLLSEKNAINNKYNILNGKHSKLKSEYKELDRKTNIIQGQLINTNNKSKIIASDRFGELKSQYLKKIELVDTQEELLTKQNKSIRDYEKLIKKNKKTFDSEAASASKYARELLYNKKDLEFYHTATNVLKFILLAISIAIIYLLMKK